MSSQHARIHRGHGGAVAVLLVLSLIAAACGDDEDAPPVGTSSDTVAPADDAVDEPEDAATSEDPEESEADALSDDPEEPEAPEDQAAPDGDVASDEPCVRAAFVMAGNRADSGWNRGHVEGAQQVQDAFPCADVLVLEDVPETPEVEATFRDIAEDGYDIIFGTAFGYMDYMLEVAPDFPDVAFEHASGFLTLDNMSHYFGGAYEATYLAGMAAGLATESNRLGYVGSFAIPNILRDFNAWVLGAREVNPDVEVQMVWVNAWVDAAQETQAAETLLASGADAFFMGTSSSAVGQAADAGGAVWTGQSHGAVRNFAPDSYLTGFEYNWGAYYLKAVQAVLDGAWVAEPYFGTMGDNFILLTDFGPALSDDAISLIEERREEILAGDFVPYAGPLVNQSGETVLADGEVADVAHLNSVDYVLQGVEGQLP